MSGIMPGYKITLHPRFGPDNDTTIYLLPDEITECMFCPEELEYIRDKCFIGVDKDKLTICIYISYLDYKRITSWDKRHKHLISEGTLLNKTINDVLKSYFEKQLYKFEDDFIFQIFNISIDEFKRRTGKNG